MEYNIKCKMLVQAYRIDFKEDLYMARTRRPRNNKTTTELIVEAQNAIEIKEQELHELNEQLKELYKQLEQEKIEALLQTIKEKDISLDMAKEIIDNV